MKRGVFKPTDFSKDAVLRDGDQIDTSNISTKFLPGILVGYAADVSIDPTTLTQSGYLIPVADFNNLQEVLIITDIKDTGEGRLPSDSLKIKQVLINILFIVLAFTVQNCVFPLLPFLSATPNLL